MTQTERIGHEPIQKPGKSKQDYGTPMAFIRAVEAKRRSSQHKGKSDE